jgi:hydrogenase/urease accessory protein HupE
MESLAILVAILFLIALLAGPIAIALSAVRGKSPFLNVIRKILHGFFVAMSLWVGLMFFSNPDLPFVVNLIGLFGLVMGYIALRREYFPDVKILAPLLAKFGFKTGSAKGLDDDAPSGGSNSRHGPRLKWPRSGGSSGKDGHGPGGQH